jgi:hypothetical protein
VLIMSYHQPPFPQTAYGAPTPAFPDQQPSYAQAANMGWQGAPQQQQQQNNDFAFYTPPPQQQQQQQPQASPPMPMSHADGWNQTSGARMRPLQPMNSPGGSVDPNAVAFMPQQLMSNPMAGMALDYGKASLAKNLSWVMSFLSALKYYFHVNNRYVLAKIKVLLLPFLHSNWKRERMDGGGAMAGADDSMLAGLVGAPIYKAPRDDINAPDLYIPTMAFITFTLVMGYALGIGNQFHPEVLGITASRNLILLFFEVLGLKGGLYLISVGPATPSSLLDLVSYASYKYIHCILMILIGLVLGSWCFYASILILGTLAALFMMRTMKRVCTPATAAGGDHSQAALAGGYNIGTGSSFGQGKHRRNYFLLFIGAVQILFSWFLVRTANTGF